MRNALIRLAPCAVFLSAFASAQLVEKTTTVGPTNGVQGQVGGMNVNAPSGVPGGLTAAPGLQGSIGGTAPAPLLNTGAAPAKAVPLNGVAPVAGVAPAQGEALPIKSVGAQTPSQAVAPAALGAAGALKTHRAAKSEAAEAAEAKGAAPAASKILDTTARNVAQGIKAEAAGGDGLSVRQALDRAYDTSTRGGALGGDAGVAGKFTTAREKIAGLVGVANNAAPADAPNLYRSAIKTAEETLPSAAAKAVARAVYDFAARKADASLSELAQAAYTAATTGQTAEAKRLVKSLDQWEGLLGEPGRPLISNGDRLKAGIENAITAGAGGKVTTPRVWVVKRGGSYVAALPGSTVEKVPGLRAAFALKLEKLSLSPMGDAYRAFVARPGARSAIAARTALGESVPSATLSTGWLWLKYMIMRAWSALTAWLPGRSLPTTATASTLPRLREAAKSWSAAVGYGESAARAADKPNLTVSRARGAFALALKSAAAHEVLTGEAGAVSRVASLTAEFEAGVKRAGLTDADRLPAGLASIVSGDGGLRHWASVYASDARRRGDAAFEKVRGPSAVVVLGDGPAALEATALAAASKDMSFTAFGDELWASGSGAYGGVKLAADLRSTENGGSVTLEAERGDNALASALDEIGFAVTPQGRGLSAKLGAETISADARQVADLAAEGAALITGARVHETFDASEGIERLLADIKRAPKAATDAAKSLDGSAALAQAKAAGVEGDDEIVYFVNRRKGLRVIALRDPAKPGVARFARIEPLRAR